MEPPKSDVGVLSTIVGILSFLGGILVGVIRVSWSLSKFDSKYDNRMSKVEKDVRDFKDIIFHGPGKLNLLSIDDHKEICIVNQEKFGMLIDSLENKIKEIRTNDAEIKQLREVLQRVEVFLSEHRKR